MRTSAAISKPESANRWETSLWLWLALLVAAVLLASPLEAQQAAAPAGEERATELAKKAQNPVADLISMPFQNNLNFGAGTTDATLYVLNAQPVIRSN